MVLAEFKESIKGYGFISDLLGETKHGVDKERVQALLDQGYTIREDFVEDPSLEPHRPFNGERGYEPIPRGTLQIVVVKP